MRQFTQYIIIATLLTISAVNPVQASMTNVYKPYFQEFLTAYDKFGNDQYMIQEEITQRAHVLQAAHIAQMTGAPEDIIVGLLFHDIGQVADPSHLGDTDYLHQYHDDIGAKWLLDRGFPQDVADLLQYHTLVKVVLCEQEKDYCDNLSEASKISYEFQRVKYAAPDKKPIVDALKNHRRLKDYKAARRCDEMAKIIALEVNKNQNPHSDKVSMEPLEYYAEMTERVRQGKGKPAINPNWHHNVKTMHTFMKQDRTAFEAAVVRGDVLVNLGLGCGCPKHRHS